MSFANRLRKNFKHLRRWAEREGTDAFRVYDRDMPEHPVAVEWYSGRVQLQLYSSGRSVPGDNRLRSS